MLVHARMKRAALALTLVATSTTVASAGGYVGLGIGTAPAVVISGPDLDVHEDGRSGRLIGGFRFGRIAVEGAVGQFDFAYRDSGSNLLELAAYQAQVSAKYSLPLQDGFGVFGRVGLLKQWFNFKDSDGTYDLTGTALVAGAGFEYRLPTVLDLNLFVEYQYSRGDMSGDRLDFGSTNVRMWTLGATIGF